MKKPKLIGTQRVVANRHRHVHKGLGALIIGFWILATITSVFLIAGYLDSRHQIHLSQSGINFKVDSVKYDDVGKYPFVPPPGYQYVIVHITVTNKSAETFNFAPVLQTYMVSPDGDKYYMSPANLTDPIIAGAIGPSDKRSGSLSYLVPVNAQKLTMRFKL